MKSNTNQPGAIRWASTSTVLRNALVLTLVVGGVGLSGKAFANPLGGVVASGAATITNTPTSTNVNQSTNKAIINWSSFNIAPNETTTFAQPNASSVALNRIGDANPSQILGTLNANGQLMLVNKNGMFFGKKANVNVAGLVATTADIDDSDFLAGKYNFRKAGNPNAQVVNNGEITAKDGGYVAMVAPIAQNKGTITANAGKVSIGGGDVFTLDLTGDKLINLALPTGVARTGAKGNHAEADNSGAIYADKGRVQMTATSANTLVDSIVNMDGSIQARSANGKQGVITLEGDNVDVAGDLDVSGKGSYDDGGTITATARKNMSFSGTAKADAGWTGGGEYETASLDSAKGGNGGGYGGHDDDDYGNHGGYGDGGHHNDHDHDGDGYGGKGGNITFTGEKNISLGGEASADGKKGKRGTVTFNAGDTFNMNTPEAYSVNYSLQHAGLVNVAANNTINVNDDLESQPENDAMTTLAKGGNGGGYGGNDGHGNGGWGDHGYDNGHDGKYYTTELHFDDRNNNNNLTVNLKDKLYRIPGEKVTGDGTKVNVANTASIQDGVDVSSENGSKIVAAAGTYNENVNVNKNNIDLDPTGESPVINGYVNVSADFDKVHGFIIKGGTLDGKKVGVNIDGGQHALIYDNDIEGKGGTGVNVKNSDQTRILNNKISNADTGVKAENSDSFEVIKNHITAKNGVDVKSSNAAKITENIIKDGNSGGVGVKLKNADNAAVSGNDISAYQTGVEIDDSKNVFLQSNKISSVNNGVDADDADNLRLDKNTLTGKSASSGTGVRVNSSSNVKLTNNTANNFGTKYAATGGSTVPVKTGNNF